MQKISRFILAIIIVISTCFAYSSSLKNQFVFDDGYLIVDNIYTKSWVHLPKIFIENNMAASFGRRTNFYRPIQIFTYLLEYSFWKSNVLAYHITNILLHILVALLIFWFISLLFNNIPLAFLTSIFYAVHPVHTEVVTYISGRSDSLALLFMLFSFILYIKQLSVNRAKVYIAMLVSYIFALLSRETSLMLPLLILFYHSVFRKRIKEREFLSIFGISIIYILLRVFIFPYTLSNISVTSTIFQRIPGFFAAIFNYLRILLFPLDLHMEYGNRIFQFSDPQVISGAAILILLLIYLVKKRNNSIILFSLSWFLILLLPVSGIIPINAYMAEHWLYVPSIGFFLLLAYGLNILYNKKKYQIFAAVFIITLLAFFSCLTFRQNGYWRDGLTFFTRTLKYSPDSQKVLINLGSVYNNTGDRAKAINFYKRAVDIDQKSKDIPYAYNGLGSTYQGLGRYEEAIFFYKKAIESNPGFAAGYNNLCGVYMITGNVEEAIRSCNKAIQINPLFPQPYYNLGNTYVKVGDNIGAIKAYQEAIRIDPSYSDVYTNLALAYAGVGRNDDAEKCWNKAVYLDPNNAMSHSNLAVFYFYHKRYNLAVEHCQKAIALGVKFEPEFLRLLFDHLEDDLKK